MNPAIGPGRIWLDLQVKDSRVSYLCIELPAGLPARTPRRATHRATAARRLGSVDST